MKRRNSEKRKHKSHTKVKSSSTDKTIVGLSSVHVDNEAKQIVLFTEDMLLNQLRRDGPKIEASFDRLCESDLIQLSALVSRTTGLIYSGFAIAARNGDKLREAAH